MRYLLIALLLTGCATMAKTDTISFDRGAFALTYADWSARLKADCAKTPSDLLCSKLDLLDAQIRQEIITAPQKAAANQSSSLDALLPILMKLAPLAAGL